MEIMKMSGNENKNEQWVVVELMGHGRTAGVIRTETLGGLLRIDVPVGDDGFQTRYFGEAAIYSISVVSEEIARAYATPEREILAYNEPIVPRAEYEKALQSARQRFGALERRNRVLEQRLTAVRALPAGDGYGFDTEDDPDEYLDEYGRDGFGMPDDDGEDI
jgi:hypothetical protein